MEFGFITLPDRLCITSSISPQMRIPYVLEFIHGTSGLITGRLMGALAITKTNSDQLEMATMLPAEFWKCADESRRAIAALIDALGDMKVNTIRMAQCANEHWSQASTVVGFLVKEHGMSYRTGHQILALMMQSVADKGISPPQMKAAALEQAIEQYTGKRIAIPQATLDRLFDAMQCVRERKYRGGAAPERVLEHIVAAREALTRDRAVTTRLGAALDMAEHRLDGAFSALRQEYGV